MELADYIRIVRKRWVFIVSAMLVGIAIAAVASIVQRPTYTATTQVFVSTQSGETVGELAQGNSFTLQRVNTYARLADTQTVLAPVVEDLGLTMSLEEVAKLVSASPVNNATIIDVSASAETGQLAADLANAAAASLAEQVQILEAPNDGQVSPVSLEVVEPASVPGSPVSPRIPLNIAVGAIAGLLLAGLFSFLREVLDTRIRSEQDVRHVSELPVVGGIAFDPKAMQRPLIVHQDPLNPRAEAFRSLRTNLQFVEVDGAARSFVVTSSIPGEGKSTTTSNLALALADAGQTVILIDADLRKPKIAEYLNLEGGVGLTDVLIGRVSLEDAVQQWGTSSLYVLPAGQVPPNPSELLGSKAMEHLIRELEQEFDWVIFDAPPLLPVTDAAILSKHLTGVIVAIAAGKTTRHQLKVALGALETVDAPVAGAVLTMLPTKGADAYGYGYGYGHYGYQQAATKPRRSLSRKRA